MFQIAKDTSNTPVIQNAKLHYVRTFFFSIQFHRLRSSDFETLSNTVKLLRSMIITTGISMHNYFAICEVTKGILSLGILSV